MKINEKLAKKIFLSKFPSGIGKDFAGREMLLNDYGKVNSLYGWDIDHILPISIKEINSLGNLQCTNIITNRKKADYTTWSDKDEIYQVQRVKYQEKTYQVVEI